jgi:hypothetical protein
MEEYERLAKLALLKNILEQRDSIKVIKTSTGKYSFEVKRYYDFGKTYVLSSENRF